VGLVLDTNALSALAEGEPKAVKACTSADEIAIPVIVLGEYRFGISQSRHKREYQRWLDELLPACKILEVDEETALNYAEIRSRLKKSGTPIPSNDLWIAALCVQHTSPILTRDRHYEAVSGLKRLSW
jgi:tRNA(fMet)-specific endonuclease VapC